MENKEMKQQEKSTPKSYKLRPSTQEEINAAIASEPGRTTDEIFYDMAHSYNLFKRGKALASHAGDINQFDDCISHMRSLYCTALEGNDAIKNAMQDRYDQLIKNSQDNIADLSAKEKKAKDELEKVIEDVAMYKKEADTALQRVKDLEDKVSALTKADKMSEMHIADLTAQLSAASEKAARYDVLLEENKVKATRIRDLEEEVRALEKDLAHEKEKTEQRIRIIQLEAEKRDTKATWNPEADSEDIDIAQDLPFD